ncbi:MAG: PAS domain-containing protein [Gammaproteobacteria bacterium]
MQNRMDPELAARVLEGLMRYSSAVMFVKDRDGRYLAVSDGWQAVTGVSADQALLRHDLEVFGPEVGGRFSEADTRVMLSGQMMQLQESLIDERGEQYFITTKFPLLDENAQVLGVCGVATDITAMRKTQMAIRSVVSAAASASGVELLEALVSELASIVSADFCFVGRINESRDACSTLSLRIHGQPAENFTYNLRNTPCANVVDGGSCFYPRDIRRLFPNDHILQSMSVQAYVGRAVHNSKGEVIGLLVALFERPLAEPEFIDDLFGLVSGRIGAEMERLEREADIIRLNADLEKRVEKRTRELQHALQEVETFNYCVSHDLKAPLRAIKGFSQILLEDEVDRLSDEGQRVLQRVINAASQMQGQIDALNALVKLDSTPVKRRKVDVSALAKRLADTLLANDGETRFSVRIEPGMQAVCDPGLAEIVLVQLLENAIKYSRHRPQPLIEIFTTQRAGRSYFVMADNGVGFSMDYAEKLFAPFQRLHSAQHYDGVGIGLASVARIIYRHDGDLWAEGEPDKGARFGFCFNGDE